jgi:3-hydroxyisobutyrate dehydrogenase
MNARFSWKAIPPTGYRQAELNDMADAVAVVGVGAMGGVIAERFVQAGLPTTVFDVSEQAVQRAVASGAVAARSPAEAAAAADYCSVMVRTDDQMLASVLGPDGALSSLRPGTSLLLHSTISPRTTRQIGEAAQAHNVDVIDACIAGVPSVLRAGDAVCLAGGNPSVVERLTPHLLLLVRRVLHMGPLGCGNVAKIVRNLVNLTDQLILSDALRLTESAGIAPEQFARVISLIYASRVHNGQVHIDRAHPMGNLFDTILPLATSLADDLGVDLPLTRSLAEGLPPRR